MRTHLIILFLLFTAGRIKADTLTLYLEFSLESNERLVIMSETKCLYQSREKVSYLFDSVKLFVDSVNGADRLQIYIVRNRLLGGKWEPVHYNIQSLKEFKHVLLFQRTYRKRVHVAATYYLREPLKEGISIHCGYRRFWFFRKMIHRIRFWLET
ncbi:MAG: hypothetical protein IM638_10440 [Bacteroidetes bacterium]|nr:hypothetical protein [Bacteroidota bacterium]